MRRDERLEIIAKLITEQEIKTQEELVERLQEHGVDITQATVSRDIKTLALVKMPAKSGGYCYALPGNEKSGQTPGIHHSLVFEAIQNVKVMDKMLCICANPGTTSLIKNRLLQDFSADLFTVIIDDDSVLAIFETEAAAQKVLELLKTGL